jgi:hypothetical protein
MPILSQTLKGHNSETVCPFELKFVMEIYFDQLYLRSTREVLGIDQSIAIDILSTPAIGYGQFSSSRPTGTQGGSKQLIFYQLKVL